jgi:hypothetical protein
MKIFIVGRRLRPTCYCCSSSSSSSNSTWTMTTNCCNSTTDSAAACYYCWLLPATVWHHVINKQAHCQEWKEKLSSREKRKRRRRRKAEKKIKKSQGQLLAGPTLMRPCSASATSKQKRKKERKKERKGRISTAAASYLGRCNQSEMSTSPNLCKCLCWCLLFCSPSPPFWAERDAVLCCSSSLLPACRRHHRLLRLSRTCACCLSLSLSLFLTLDPSSS